MLRPLRAVPHPSRVARRGARRLCMVLGLISTLMFARWALADETAPTPGLQHATAKPGEKGHYEFTPAPLLGGSSDVGIGGGVLASFARREPGFEPYLYRLELTATTTFKRAESGKLSSPYQDYYLLLALPHVRKDRVALDIRVSYTREANLKYYGLGNASRVPSNVPLEDPFYEYVRVHPEARAHLTARLVGPLALNLGVFYTYNTLDVPPSGLLAQDSSSANPEVRKLARFSARHSTLFFSYGFSYDGRDDQVATTRGQYYATRFDWSPGGSDQFPYRYARWNTNARWYWPLKPYGSVVGLRVTTDFLFGAPPIYELARFDDTPAFGGANGVRGVPGERYHGKAKAFANLEWRQVLFNFRALGKANGFALALFVDSGRLWTDYAPHPELDGTGAGLKWGVGAGPRLLAGKSFLLRADVAWSPDARPVGVYITSGDIF
ncbi:MAG TPA: BamA/TamA family outer membrane protein [Polyangiaceae bacterium]